jgi:FKBP-type peptidyl-prolyl cis-trans isomerase SlyD
MNNSKTPNVVADDVVVSLEYTLTVDGEVVDTTEGDDPIQFIQGHENIIPGLEKELYGLKVGDKKSVSVPAKDAYGEIDPEAVVEVPRSDIPKDIPVKLGTELTVRNEDGELLDARITAVNKATVELDFNHPLAGKDLKFDVTVVSLREAEAEELEHGHVHGDDMDEDEEEFEFDEEEFDEYEDEDEYVDDDELDELDSLDGKSN